MKTTLTEAMFSEAFYDLDKANQTFARNYPGESPDRQPVHTLYGGAQLFKSTTIPRIGELACQHFDEYAPDHRSLMQALGIEGNEKLWKVVHARVRERL